MQKRILIVSQEVFPYIENSNMAEHVLELAKKVKKNKDIEVRLFMPQYGCVNERRHQLHEVIRLSGVNIVINDIDQPLIVKVASIPQARLQVYFIDNDEYFQRKAILKNKNQENIADNDERMMFFCRGVLETLQMLGWSPDIIHCHGWFTSLLPLYLKKIYNTHQVFENTKIISSFYNENFDGNLNSELINKIKFDGIEHDDINILKKSNYKNLQLIASQFSDGIIFEQNYMCKELTEFANNNCVSTLHPEENEQNAYYHFYQNFFSEALV